MTEEQIPVKPIELIKFGKTLLATEIECFLGYGVYCFSDNSALTTTGHILYKYLTAIKTVFSSIAHISFPADPVTNVATTVVALRNLARLARLHLEGDSLVHTLNNLSNELALLPNGVVCTTKTVSDLYIDVAKYIVGGDMKNFIGSWDNQKYADQDEVIGGIFIVLFYIMLWWNMHLASMNQLLHSIGEFTSNGKEMRGTFKPLIPSDPKTWGANLVSQENSVGASVFGITTAQLDDPAFRGITVTRVAGFENLMNRLCTPSQWTWRFGRWMRVIPIFSMVSFESSSDGDGSLYTDFANLMGSAGLFSNTGTHKWRDFNNDINQFVSDLKTFYFKNSAYGDLKAKFTLTTFAEIPTPAPSGNGGILFYQMMDWIDGGILSTDKLRHKFYVDDDDCGHQTLKCRRVFNAEKRFMIIGDAEVEDYQLHHALIANQVDDQAGDVKSLGINKDPISIKAYFGFGIGRTEDEVYKIGRVINDNVAIVNVDSALEDFVPGACTWTLYTNSLELSLPISLNVDKTLFYHGRNQDPFKKLQHQVVDVNELDIDKVLNVARKYIFPVSNVSSIMSTPIAVSAMPIVDDIPKLGVEQTKVSDDVNNKVESLVTKAPVAVSAVPASVALADKDKKEDKK